jgi:hypothetical protein
MKHQRKSIPTEIDEIDTASIIARVDTSREIRLRGAQGIGRSRFAAPQKPRGEESNAIQKKHYMPGLVYTGLL